MRKLVEGGEADKSVAAGPAVFLPEQRPELELIEGGEEVEGFHNCGKLIGLDSPSGGPHART